MDYDSAIENEPDIPDLVMGFDGEESSEESRSIDGRDVSVTISSGEGVYIGRGGTHRANARFVCAEVGSERAVTVKPVRDGITGKVKDFLSNKGILSDEVSEEEQVEQTLSRLESRL